MMDKSEKLKMILKEKYQRDYDAWLDEKRQVEEEELAKRKVFGTSWLH